MTTTTESYHCTGCRHSSGTVGDDCCTCCRGYKKRQECQHPIIGVKTMWPDDPPEYGWQECADCGQQWADDEEDE